MKIESHVFTFSRNWVDGKRLCGSCHLTYDEGEHVHVAILEPYTNYVCPSGGGLGHRSVWSGSQSTPELRSLTDDKCVCGATLVKEDTELWLLSWDMRDPYTGKWRPMKRMGTRYSTHGQREGLLTMPDDIANVRLVKVAP